MAELESLKVWNRKAPYPTKWPQREAIVLELAGVVPAEEIAKRLGITRGALSCHCSKRSISLKVEGRVSASITEVWRKRRDCVIKMDHYWRPTSLSI